MQMYKFLLLMLVSFFSSSMQQKTDWLIPPQKFILSNFSQFYKRLYKIDLSGKEMNEIRYHLRIKIHQEITKKDSSLDESSFMVKYSHGPAVVVAVYSGIRKCEYRDYCFWQGWLDSPLHASIFKNNYYFMAALLSINADTSFCNAHGKTPLDLAKERKCRMYCQEKALKEYTWHKHVLLHKRFSEKWGDPFNKLPVEMVAQIAVYAYGFYK